MQVVDHSVVMTGGWDGVIRVLDLRQRSIAQTLTGHGSSCVWDLKYVPQSSQLFASHGMGLLKSWDLRDLSKPNVLLEHFGSTFGHVDPVNKMAYQNGRLFTASDDRTIRIHDTVSGKCLETLSGHAHSVTGLHVAGDDLFSCAMDGVVRCYDLVTINAAIEHNIRVESEGKRIAEELYIAAERQAKAARAKKRPRKKKAGAKRRRR